MVSNRWLIVLLLISISLNIGMVGFFAGRASAGDFRPPRLDATMNLGHVMRQLTPERRDALEEPIANHLRSMRGEMRSVRERQKRLNEQLRADPLDRSALSDALDSFQQSMCQSMAAGKPSLLVLAEQMTPAERALLAQGRRPPGRGHPPRSRQQP